MESREWTTEPIVLAQVTPEGCTWDEWQSALESVIPETWQVIHATGGTAEGTYLRQADGQLQILGYSMPLPDELHELVNVVWERAWGQLEAAEED